MAYPTKGRKVQYTGAALEQIGIPVNVGIDSLTSNSLLPSRNTPPNLSSIQKTDETVFIPDSSVDIFPGSSTPSFVDFDASIPSRVVSALASSTSIAENLITEDPIVEDPITEDLIAEDSESVAET